MFDLSLADSAITAAATVVVAWVTANAGQANKRIANLTGRVEELERWRDEEEDADVDG